ncbi:hypothetical protein [Vibrio sp.]|uniref:hypothetical protein n=1 Tax=Vibrio sp. TaxID=678 RepID=UPI003D0ABBE1
MVHATSQHRAVPTTAAIHLQPQGVERQPDPCFGTDRQQVELLKAVAKQVKLTGGTSSEAIFCHHFNEAQFCALMALADQLGLQLELDRLFDQTEETNLSDFLSLLTQRLEQQVEAAIKAKTDNAQQDLIALLEQHGHTFDRQQLVAHFNAALKCDMGSLEIGVNGTTETNFDCDDKLYLSLCSNEPALFMNTARFRSTARDTNLYESVVNVIHRQSNHALIIADPEAIFDRVPEFYQLADYIGDKLGELKDVDALWALAVERGYMEECCWMGEDDEETKESMTEVISEMLSIYETSSGSNTASTYLSEWFDKQFTPLPTDCFSLQSHSYPLHFWTDSDSVEQAINQQPDYYYEESQSRLHLEPEVALDTLTAIGYNRNLIMLFDALCSIGYESEFVATWLKENGITPSKTTIL